MSVKRIARRVGDLLMKIENSNKEIFIQSRNLIFLGLFSLLLQVAQRNTGSSCPIFIPFKR